MEVIRHLLVSVGLADFRHNLISELKTLRNDVAMHLKQFTSVEDHHNEVSVTLFGQLTQTERRLEALIDGLLTTLGTQLQDIIDHLQMGDANKRQDQNMKRTLEDKRKLGIEQLRNKRREKTNLENEVDMVNEEAYLVLKIVFFYFFL